MLSDASRIVRVVEKVIDSKQRSSAGIELTYGQVFALSGMECSVYIAGSRELAIAYGQIAIPTDGFRVPASVAVHANDFVRISLDDRGHRWIEDVIPNDVFPKATLDTNVGAILLGNGSVAPTIGLPGQVPQVNAAGTGMAYATPNDLVYVPFAYQNPGANDTGIYMKASDVDNTSTSSFIRIPWDFEVVGVSITASVARSAGTFTVTPELSNSTANFSAQLNATDTTSKSAVGSETSPVNKGVAGNYVALKYTTVGWAPTTDYIFGGLWVLVHRTQLSATTVSASFTADAVLRLAGGAIVFTADAVLKKTISFTFTADAVLAGTGATTIAADDFSANQSGGWGTADTGGAWTTTDAAKTDVI